MRNTLQNNYGKIRNTNGSSCRLLDKVITATWAPLHAISIVADGSWNHGLLVDFSAISAIIPIDCLPQRERERERESIMGVELSFAIIVIMIIFISILL